MAKDKKIKSVPTEAPKIAKFITVGSMAKAIMDTLSTEVALLESSWTDPSKAKVLFIPQMVYDIALTLYQNEEIARKIVKRICSPSGFKNLKSKLTAELDSALETMWALDSQCFIEISLTEVSPIVRCDIAGVQLKSVVLGAIVIYKYPDSNSGRTLTLARSVPTNNEEVPEPVKDLAESVEMSNDEKPKSKDKDNKPKSKDKDNKPKKSKKS